MNLLAVAFMSAFLSGFTPDYQKASASVEFIPDSKTYVNQFAFQTMYEYESKSLSANAGLRAAEKEFDFTTGFSVFPFQFNKWKIGLLGRFHCRVEPEIFNQYDVFAGFDFVIQPLDWLKINPRIAYYSASSEIIPLRPYGTQWYHNNSHYLSLKVSFIPKDWMEFYVGAQNCENFYYRMISSASFSLGANFNLPYGFTCGLEIVSRWTDLVTLSAFYDGTDILLSAGYRW